MTIKMIQRNDGSIIFIGMPRGNASYENIVKVFNALSALKKPGDKCLAVPWGTKIYLENFPPESITEADPSAAELKSVEIQ